MTNPLTIAYITTIRIRVRDPNPNRPAVT